MRAALLTAALVFVAGACGSDDGGGPRLAEDQPAGESESAATTAAPPEEDDDFVVGEKVVTELGNEVIVYSYEQPVPLGEYETVDPGMELAAIDVEGCAYAEPQTAGSAVASINPYDFELQMADNRRLTAYYSTARQPALNATDLYLGDCVRGWVVYQVPAGVRPVAVRDNGTEPPVSWVIPA